MRKKHSTLLIPLMISVMILSSCANRNDVASSGSPEKSHSWTDLPISGLRFGMSDHDAEQLLGTPSNQHDEESSLSLSWEHLDSAYMIAFQDATSLTLWFCDENPDDEQQDWQLYAFSMAFLSDVDAAECSIVDFYGLYKDKEESFSTDAKIGDEAIPYMTSYTFEGWSIGELPKNQASKILDSVDSSDIASPTNGPRMNDSTQLLSITVLSGENDAGKSSYPIQIIFSGMPQIYM